jgi:hypothetical protein
MMRLMEVKHHIDNRVVGHYSVLGSDERLLATRPLDDDSNVSRFDTVLSTLLLGCESAESLERHEKLAFRLRKQCTFVVGCRTVGLDERYRHNMVQVLDPELLATLIDFSLIVGSDLAFTKSHNKYYCLLGSNGKS